MTCTIPTYFPSSPDSSPSLLDNKNSLAATLQATSLHLTSVDCAVLLDSSIPIFDATLLPFRERNTFSYHDRAFSLGSKIFDKGVARLQPGGSFKGYDNYSVFAMTDGDVKNESSSKDLLREFS